MTQPEARAGRAGVSRRTVVKTAAWSVPVIAAATSVPLAAASEEPPPAANYALVSVVVNPKVGSNPTFTATGQVENGGDYSEGTLKAGEYLTITFENGATADSYSSLVGLTWVSGDPVTGGPVVFQVTADTQTVRVKLNNVSPAGGTIRAEILGGEGVSNIIA